MEKTNTESNNEPLKSKTNKLLANKYAVRFGIKPGPGIPICSKVNENTNWRIKQIIHLPENITVMIPMEDEFGRVFMTDVSALPLAYCLALCEDVKDGLTEVFPYDISEGLNLKAECLPVRTCTRCKARMRIPFMISGDISTAIYHCDNCNHEERAFLDDESDYNLEAL